MSLPVVRFALLISVVCIYVALALVACGGEQAGSVAPGAPILAPSAHPSPDPPPGVPLILTKEDAGDASADADSDAGHQPTALNADARPRRRPGRGATKGR